MKDPPELRKRLGREQVRGSLHVSQEVLSTMIDYLVP